VLSGPSGAGKTILFEIIAGIVNPVSGQVMLDGKDITGEKIQHRDIGLVFQDGAVFPHLKVKDNIAYALKHRGFSRKQIISEVMDIAGELSITHLLDRKPITLSGGELQRVAIARTLVLQPRCLLLDEPLSSLDIQLREGIRSLLRSLNRKGLTILHITHEFYEAYALANRISIMDSGRIVQTDTPENIYKCPSTPFVANFAGRRNFFSREQIRKIIPESNLNIPSNTGFIIIPDQAIKIETAEIKNVSRTIAGKVIEVIKSPDRIEIKVDCGLPLHITLPAREGSVDVPERNSSIVLGLMPEEFVFTG
jgi:ABC-type sugar transport system ATPase subunit